MSKSSKPRTPERTPDFTVASCVLVDGRLLQVARSADSRTDSELALLLRLFVTPKSRGHGAARSLVSAAVEFLREGGYRRVVLDTHKEQLEPAYRLYRSLGFEECEPYRAVTYDCPTFMELRVWPRHPKT